MRITPVGKVFIALVIVCVAGYVAWVGHYSGHGHGGHGEVGDVHDHEHEHDHGAAPPSSSRAAAPSWLRRGKQQIVVGMGEFGGVYPGVVANDGARPGPGSRFSAHGLKVEFKLIRDLKERLAAFDHGEIDVMILTLDHLASLVPAYHDKGTELRSFLMADWSRGNLGIAASPRIRAVEDLKDAHIAVGRNSSTHFFLLMMLRDSNLLPAEVDRVKSNLVFATRLPYATEMFRRGDVDALATWEPYLSRATASGKGHLLISTATATNLVTDVLFARAEFLREREPDIINFTRAWLEGVALCEQDPRGSAGHFAQAAGLSHDEAHDLLTKLKPAAFADNREFFGLEHEQALYLELFDDAEQLWQREGLIKQPVPAADTRWLHALEAVAREHAGEKVHEDFTFRKGGPKKGARPLLTKSVTIYFASGSDRLLPEDRKIIDAFAEELDEFGNTYIRVEGHTDSVGSAAANLALSKRRAQAVVDDLVGRHGLPPARFQVVGHGASKPRGSNDTAAGRDMNRRTDFILLQNE